jgi:osmoprotectant transport system permease protein
MLALSAWAVGTAAMSWTADSGRAVRIGAKTFTEQYILADLLAQRIEHATGGRPDVLSSLGSTVVFDALRTGQVDLYVDYDGTIWATVMKAGDPPSDASEVLRKVGAYLAREHGIELVCALGFENAYALAVRTERSRAWSATRIGDLAPRAAFLAIGGDYEFFARPEWEAVRDAYDLRFSSERTMDASLMYQAVAAGDVDVISAFTTDGRIAAYDLTVLEDDRGAIPPYNAIVLASGDLMRSRPDVVASLRPLCGAIDTDAMRAMNRAVDVDGQAPAAVATTFLSSMDVGL